MANPPTNRNYLDLPAVLIMIGLTLLWGFNVTTVKYINRGISPIFASTLRSMIASLCGILYCLQRGEKLFHTNIFLFHGIIVGILFGLEFLCIYLGMVYTDSARATIFINLSPFIVAIGAHFFLKGDQLTYLKMMGLILAFSGVFIVFQGRPSTAKASMLFGDVLEILAAFLWGATTLYIKRFLADKIHPIHTFLYQLVFSIPILLGMSILLEPIWIREIDLSILGTLFYQSAIVAFFSYFTWFKLIHKYSVSKLSSFTLLTPIFGVFFGILLLGEEFTISLMVGLPLVSTGIFLVNWRR